MDDRSRILESIRDGYGKVYSKDAISPPLFRSRDRHALSEEWIQIKKRNQAARSELIDRLCRELQALSGSVEVVRDDVQLHCSLRTILAAAEAKQAITWQSPFLEQVGLYELLNTLQLPFVHAGPTQSPPDPSTLKGYRDAAKRADVGISGVDFAIADSGTLVLKAGAGRERMVSLLPPIHIAIMRSEDILGSLEEFITRICLELEENGQIESCLTLVTGPSRTGDIELTLVKGVHGPGELHLIIIDKEAS